MKQQIILALGRLTTLSDSEKELIAEIVQKLSTVSNTEKVALNESLSKSITTYNFAPVPGTCPRCGK